MLLRKSFLELKTRHHINCIISDRFPEVILTRHKLQDRLFRFLFHYTPALVIDGVLTVLRRPTFMRKLITNMTIGIEAINFFCLHQWSWTNTNLNNLQSALVNTDTESLESFSFDIRSLDWKIFTDHNILGMRHYVLKDKPETLDSSRKKLNILYFLHRLIQLAFVFFVIYNLLNVFMDVPPSSHQELWSHLQEICSLTKPSTP